jgi:putative ribosome biogenesis GTPase RsgA
MLYSLDAPQGIRHSSEDDSKGRHTTSHRPLIVLDSGVMIIDTPGMRALGMWDVSRERGEAFNGELPSEMERLF